MDNLNRSELKLILSGLHREREALRAELLPELPPGQTIMDDPEYYKLVRLQNRIIDSLERLPY